MDDTNSLQQGQASATAYQYNYTYIESIALVDTLPPGENFSEPWLVLTAKQAIKLAINTLIVDLGDQGKPGFVDDVQGFLTHVLLKTLQDEDSSFKLKLVTALSSLLPQLLAKDQATAKVEVGATRGIETPSGQPQTVPLTDVELATVISSEIETALEKLLQDASSPETQVAVATARGVDAALEQPSLDIPVARTEVIVTTTPVPGAASPQPDTTVQVQLPTSTVSRGLETALQKPLKGMPANEDEVERFITSDLIKVLGKDFLKLFLKTILDELGKKAPRGHASSLEDYRKQFIYIALPEIASTFHTDETFAYTRVAGPNPVIIERMTAPDPRFPVTEAQYKAVMGESDSLQVAMQDGRVYLADYAGLNGALNGTFGARPPAQKYAYAPLAMFAVPVDGATRLLRPVAIQCGQDPTEYPVITPSTGETAWLMAKTIVQIADVNFHEAITHFARTHALVEPFVVSTHRKLPATHPLFKLLVPHFQGTLAINHSAHEILVAPNGGVNRLLSSTIDNSRVLIVKGFKGRGFNADMFPRRLKDRGVDDTSKLPVYPYRDDGLLIWDAIHNWVKAYVGLYYSSDDAVKQDHDLQAWASDLVAFDGGRLSDFGDQGDGKIETFDYLVEAVTMIIFTASAQHAAVNFPQNGIMSFTPAMPTAGYIPATAVRPDATQQDWLDLLPPLDQAQSQLNLVYLLGSVYFTKLGHYEANAFTDPKVTAPLTAFQQRLQEIEAEIDHRNSNRPVYDYLKPSNIPQSINI